MSELYFRVRDNGAQVFRIMEDPREARTRLEPLAVLNLRTGDLRLQGGREPTGAEQAEIDAWTKARRETLAEREVDDIRRTVEAIQTAAGWVQSKAEDDAFRMVADDLLMAAHDLRQAIVRKKADLANN